MLLAFYESQEYISYIGKKLLELQGVYYFCFILFCQEQSFGFSGSMHSQLQSKRPFTNILKENRILAKKPLIFLMKKIPHFPWILMVEGFEGNPVGYIPEYLSLSLFDIY